MIAKKDPLINQTTLNLKQTKRQPTTTQIKATIIMGNQNTKTAITEDSWVDVDVDIDEYETEEEEEDMECDGKLSLRILSVIGTFTCIHKSYSYPLLFVS